MMNITTDNTDVSFLTSTMRHPFHNTRVRET